jgi:hypothetical protein
LSSCVAFSYSCTLIHHNGIQCLGFLLPLKFLDRFDPRIVTLNPNLLEIAVPNRVHHINSTLSQSRTAGHKDNSSQGGYGQHRAFREEATDAYDDWTTHLGPNSHGTGLHSPAQKKAVIWSFVLREGLTPTHRDWSVWAFG